MTPVQPGTSRYNSLTPAGLALNMILRPTAVP
jgi:hypothetical protein